jgi:hypothetical protein
MSDYPQADDLQAGAAKRRQAIEMGALALLVVAFFIVSLLRQNPFAQGANPGKAIGIIVAAGLTLIMYSFLYRDNPLFKIGENLYVGVSLGYFAVIEWTQFLRPLVYQPLFEAPTAAAFNNSLLHLTVPVILGIMLLGQISRKHGWVSRYAYAILIGWGAGVAIPLYTNSYILQQLTAAVKPLQEAAGPQATMAPAFSQAWLVGTAGPVLGATVAMIGTVAVLFYFFFSVEHKKLGSAVSKLGIWFLMVSFGASFGYTVMGRLSLLIGRVQFLLFEWLKIPTK